MSNLMTGKQIQKYTLKMLSFFDIYARANNLKYYIAGGTLLGAVRHQGFIPWDDDVDLMLPRDDYDKLINSFPKGRYCLTCCENDPDYNTPFARLWDTNTTLDWKIIKDKKIGVFIDIFPIDGFPDGNLRTNIHLIHLKFIRILLDSAIRVGYTKTEKFKFIKRILKFFTRRNGNYYANRLNYIAKRFDISKCSYVGVKTTTDHLFKEKNNKNIFDKTLWIPFENLTLPAPSGYDIYLRHLYGDYMQLPPEEKRKSVHYFTIREKRPNNEGKSKSSSNIM